MLGLPGLAALAADGQAAAQVEGNHQLRLHCPVAVADLAIGRQVKTAVAPQRFAPRQVEQARARIVRRAHVKIPGAQAAPGIEIHAQGRLFTARAERGVRVVDNRQVSVLIAPLQALPGKTETLAAVLITEAHLLTAFTVETALADGAVEYAEIAQAHIAADTAEGQGVRGFGVAFQGEVVAQAITQAAGRHAGAVTEIAQAVILAQGASGHREVAQAFLQQAAGDVERHRGRDLSTQCIGGDHYGFAGAVDEGNVGQRVGTGLQIGAAGFVAVDEQVHRRRHRRLAGKLRQGVSHEVRTHAEIPGKLHPAQTHRIAPRQGTADQITGLVGQQPLIIGVTPGSVVTQVTIAQRTDFVTGQRAAILPGIGQSAPAVEQPHFVPCREICTGIIGVIEVQVIVEQRAKTAQGRSARVDLATADKLLGQPVRRHVQQQTLAVAVVLAVQARQAVEADFGADVCWQFHTGIAQCTGREEKLPVALLDRHDSSGVHLVDHQLQKQLRIGHSLHAAGRRRQVAGLCVMNDRQATHPTHGPQRTLNTASPTLVHYYFLSVIGLLTPLPHPAFIALAQYSAPATRH
ncbi:hypothetical protein D3C85_929980 [compost metagenome]